MVFSNILDIDISVETDFVNLCFEPMIHLDPVFGEMAWPQLSSNSGMDGMDF